MHQVCPCWCKLLGSWRWSPKTLTLLCWYIPFCFLLQTKAKVELLLNFKSVGPSLEKWINVNKYCLLCSKYNMELLFVNDDKIKVGINENSPYEFKCTLDHNEKYIHKDIILLQYWKKADFSSHLVCLNPTSFLELSASSHSANVPHPINTRLFFFPQ